MNICVQVCVSGRTSSFLGCVLGCGIAGFHSNCVYLFEQLSDCFPQQLCCFTFSLVVFEGSRVPAFLPILIIVSLFDKSRPGGCEATSYWGSDLHQIGRAHV